MILSVESGKEINCVPHRTEYEKWLKKLQKFDNTAYDQVRKVLNNIADLNEVITSSWIPGHDWHGTVYQPLYYALGYDDISAAKFYGLILFEVILHRPETWGFGRYSKDGRPIKGMTYFRLSNWQVS
ncbi:hypothetical protein [Paenibacillus abyssi]|uniref:Uncharacterized protein n=1 Tax=Paenibacillus abyssi TaxID=1340531 RepID=A0A917CZ20_9BACL|nr:hypothetical protein [Paenibacillus abyssi]GGG05423.1 hypothetical protein GCM10010916_23110 [Paenibacillus abyssi]